jgi:hypothetical protein
LKQVAEVVEGAGCGTFKPEALVWESTDEKVGDPAEVFFVVILRELNLEVAMKGEGVKEALEQVVFVEHGGFQNGWCVTVEPVAFIVGHKPAAFMFKDQIYESLEEPSEFSKAP